MAALYSRLQMRTNLLAKPTSSGVMTAILPCNNLDASERFYTGVITLSAAHTRLDFPVTALVAVAVASVVTWLSMLAVARVTHQTVGGGFARDTATRFMGLIVLSMGAKFALTGLRQFGH